jgi:hypothetical protein
MTAIIAGASSTDANNWNQVNWKAVDACVYRMQVRIAKSIQLELDGWVVRYRPLKGLSRMMGNYHVRFLGGEGP